MKLYAYVCFLPDLRIAPLGFNKDLDILINNVLRYVNGDKNREKHYYYINNSSHYCVWDSIGGEVK